MIVLKTARELELMKEACYISAMALKIAGEAVEPGVSTAEIDKLAYDYIISQGATPNFLHLYDYPATACISINNEVIHGIPSKKRIIQNGDIVSIDLGAAINGFNGDNAATFPAGDISPQAKRLCEVTEQSLYKGIEKALAGGRVGDIGAAVQKHCESAGYGVVRDFVGHGVGKKLHEDPSVPNFGTAGRGVRLLPGMTIAIEPMITMGSYKVKQLSDGWTIVTADGLPAAHFEHTVAITKDGPVIMTKL